MNYLAYKSGFCLQGEQKRTFDQSVYEALESILPQIAQALLKTVDDDTDLGRIIKRNSDGTDATNGVQLQTDAVWERTDLEVGEDSLIVTMDAKVLTNTYDFVFPFSLSLEITPFKFIEHFIADLEQRWEEADEHIQLGLGLDDDEALAYSALLPKYSRIGRLEKLNGEPLDKILMAYEDLMDDIDQVEAEAEAEAEAGEDPAEFF